MNTGTTAGPTLLLPEEAHRVWASGPGSQGLPRDLIRQATPRLRVMALLYAGIFRSEEHTSELQSQSNLVCRLLLEKKKRMRCMTYVEPWYQGFFSQHA